MASSKKKSDLEIPSRIFAQASPHSIGGVSMFDAGMNIQADNAAAFTSEDDIVQAAATKLIDAGFEVLQATESTINIAGSAKTFEKAFGAPITVHQEKVIKEGAREDMAEFLDCPNSELPGLISTRGTDFSGLLEGVALEEPRYYMAASPFPPTPEYWHHDVPAGISLACNADRAHRANITGRGVTVAMVDSGWFRHPFFTARGYRADNAILGPGASNPANDESGHGTGESANIFSLAPDVRLRPVKMNFANSIGSFNAAVGLGPDIITCSWGSSIANGPLSAANVALGNAIAAAVASGIVVVFSAGNGHWGYPGQHPDVISAGGVFMDRDGSLKASDYASSFRSNIFPGRNCPDVCGIVGMRPGAKNIMLPVEPGDQIDVSSAGGTHPAKDETAPDDGWAAFSGTSAAAPQLAGAAALIKQACARLSPAAVRQILVDTARDVTRGSNGTSNPSQTNRAGRGVDIATGTGLVDAHRASMLARLRCNIVLPISPPRPIVTGPIRPGPVRPGPITPPRPILPPRPITPPRPINPPRPITPIIPINPIRPGPVAGTDDAAASDDEGQHPISEDEMDTLEDMVRSGTVDPDEV